MIGPTEGVSVRLDGQRRRDPALVVPGELLSVYQPLIGPEATLVWLNLWFLGQADGIIPDVEREIATRFGMDKHGIKRALDQLLAVGLLRLESAGTYGLQEPLSRAEFVARVQQQPAADTAVDMFPDEHAGAAEHGVAEKAAAAGESEESLVAEGNLPADLVNETLPTRDLLTRPAAALESVPLRAVVGGATPLATPAAPGMQSTEPPPGMAAMSSLGVDSSLPDRGSDGTEDQDGEGKANWCSAEAALKAVMDFYHKKIGVLGPVQFDKLRFWVEERGMSADVVALAIEETAVSAEKPRIQYLEGILRNWFNDGVRNMQDLLKTRHQPKALKGRHGDQGVGVAARPREGVANASAYRKVDPDQVRRWKEMYADEYDG